MSNSVSVIKKSAKILLYVTHFWPNFRLPRSIFGQASKSASKFWPKLRISPFALSFPLTGFAILGLQFQKNRPKANVCAFLVTCATKISHMSPIFAKFSPYALHFGQISKSVSKLWAKFHWLSLLGFAISGLQFRFPFWFRPSKKWPFRWSDESAARCARQRRTFSAMEPQLVEHVQLSSGKNLGSFSQL